MAFVTSPSSAGIGPLDLTFRLIRAMLRSNREAYKAIQLTSGVAVGYTANLRCTLTSSTTRAPSRRVRRAFCVRAVKVGHKLGRTPVGSIAQRLSQ